MKKLILFFLLLASLPGVSPQYGNKLAPVINDLSVVARLINGISLQVDFMRSSQNLNAVVGELLGIGDSNAIPELLKVKAKDLMKDVDGILKEVKGLAKSSNPNLEAISDVVPFVNSLDLEKLKKALEPDLGLLESMWAAAARVKLRLGALEPTELVLAVKGLKYILETPITEKKEEQQKFYEELQRFVNNSDQISLIAIDIDAPTFDPLWEVFDYKPFEDIKFISKVLQDFSAKYSSFSNLVRSLTDLKTSLKDMEPVIKTIHASSIDGKILEIMENMFSGYNPKNQTIGLPNGIGDLKLIFEDLNGKWLKENLADGKDMKMLVTGLQPLQKLYQDLKPLESSWNKLKEPETGRNIGNIASTLKNGKLLDPSKLILQVDIASKCNNGLRTISYSNYIDFENFEVFYNGLETFDEELKKLKIVIDNMKNSSLLQDFKSFSKGMFLLSNDPISKPKLEADKENLFKKADINGTFKVMTEYLDSLKAVNNDHFTPVFDWFRSPFNIKKSMVQSGLVKFIECLKTEQFDHTGTEAFARFQESIEVIRAQNDTSGSMKLFANAMEPLVRTEKKLKETVNGMKVSTRRRRSADGPLVKGLLKLREPSKVAQLVGQGVQSLREISEVFDNQYKVTQIVKTTSIVDTIVQKIPEIDKKWTVTNKNALKKLVDEVNEMNNNVEEDRSLNAVWKLLATAQSVNGAPIESRILRKYVHKQLEKNSDQTVKNVAQDFKDFPQLQLDFTGSTKTILRDAYMILPTITDFFKDFFAIDTSGPPPPAEPGPDYLLYGGIGAGVLLFVAVVVGGYFGFRAYRKKKMLKSPERFLIYIAFEQTHDENIIKTIRDSKPARARELILEGPYLSMHDRTDGKTPLHLAAYCRDFQVLEFLIMGGCDRWAVDADHQTAEEYVDKQLLMYEKGELLNDPQDIVSFNLLKKAFNTHRSRTHKAKIPPLLPLEKFRVQVPSEKCQDFLDRYPGRVTYRDYNVDSTTHYVLPVDKRGVFHFTKNPEEPGEYLANFQAIFGPAICVPMKWAAACAKDSANFYKDYECRVRKVEFNGKVYETLDRLKKYARGRHVPVGAGIQVILLVDEFEDYRPVLHNMGFGVEEQKPREELERRPFWRPEMRDLIVYEGASIDKYAEQLKEVNVKKYTVLTLDEFTEILLGMEICGVDGAERMERAQMDKMKKNTPKIRD